MVRSGTIAEITSQESQHFCTVRMSWVGDAPVEQILRSMEALSDIVISGSQAIFRFVGTSDELATLLQELIAKGLRVISFGEVRQTIEDLYLKLSRNEVM